MEDLATCFFDMEKETEIKGDNKSGSFDGLRHRIVLIGKTGTGKSNLLDNVFRQDQIRSKIQAKVDTQSCQSKKVNTSSCTMGLIDTTGLFDYETPLEIAQKEIVRCLDLTLPYPHIVLYIWLMDSRVSSEVKEQLGFEILYNTVILLTHCASRKESGNEPSKFAPEVQKLSPLLKIHDNFMPFCNNLKGAHADEQLAKLPKIILNTLQRNNGVCYTNKQYKSRVSVSCEGKKNEEKRKEEEKEKDVQPERDEERKKSNCWLNASGDTARAGHMQTPLVFNTPDIRIIVLLFVVLFANWTVYGSAVDTINWKLTADKIVFGKDVVLTCFVPNGTCGKTTRLWIGGSKYRILCIDEKSSYPDKYKMAVNQKSLNFNLTIIKFNYSDATSKYTCVCGFKQYTNTIPMEENKFIYPPNLDSLEDNSDLQDKKLTINVTIPRTYPIPSCEANVNDGRVFKVALLTVAMVDTMIRKVMITHDIIVDRNSCTHIKLYCTVLANKYTVLDKEYGDCSKNDLKSYLLVMIAVPYLVGLCVVLYIFKRKAEKRVKETQCKMEMIQIAKKDNESNEDTKDDLAESKDDKETYQNILEGSENAARKTLKLENSFGRTILEVCCQKHNRKNKKQLRSMDYQNVDNQQCQGNINEE